MARASVDDTALWNQIAQESVEQLQALLKRKDEDLENLKAEYANAHARLERLAKVLKPLGKNASGP